MGWVESYVYKYTYNEKNFVLSEETYYNFEGELEPYDKTEYVYDNDNVVDEIMHEINEESGEMEPVMKISISYDMNYTKDDFIFPDGDISNNMPVKFDFYMWFGLTESWLPLGDWEMFYSQKEFTASVKPISESKISVYPNPSTDYLNIELDNNSSSANISIIDLNGRKVLSQDLMKSNQLNVKELQTGTYIYLINENGKSFGGKFVKE